MTRTHRHTYTWQQNHHIPPPSLASCTFSFPGMVDMKNSRAVGMGQVGIQEFSSFKSIQIHQEVTQNAGSRGCVNFYLGEQAFFWGLQTCSNPMAAASTTRPTWQPKLGGQDVYKLANSAKAVSTSARSAAGGCLPTAFHLMAWRHLEIQKKMGLIAEESLLGTQASS